MLVRAPQQALLDLGLPAPLPEVDRLVARVRTANDWFPTLALGSFNVIAADPPWRFKVRSIKGGGRSPEQHYATMRLDQLAVMPVDLLAARDCWLLLWVPGPHLEQGFALLRAWGFAYSGLGFVWVKTKKRAPRLFLDSGSFHVGMGYTTRKNTELCLIARRGHPKRLRKDVRELIIAPRREHSRKPDEFYDRARAFADGPRLELFAREVRPAWEAWGHEITKFTGAPA